MISCTATIYILGASEVFSCIPGGARFWKRQRMFWKLTAIWFRTLGRSCVITATCLRSHRCSFSIGPFEPEKKDNTSWLHSGLAFQPTSLLSHCRRRRNRRQAKLNGGSLGRHLDLGGVERVHISLK